MSKKLSGRKKLEANERKLEAHSMARGKCQICGKSISLSASHWSHKIPKTKPYLKKYGDEIINHDLNLVITCDLCNSKVLIDPKSNPLEAQELIDTIQAFIRR